jgi:hypothetical protein
MARRGGQKCREYDFLRETDTGGRGCTRASQRPGGQRRSWVRRGKRQVIVFHPLDLPAVGPLRDFPGKVGLVNRLDQLPHDCCPAEG